MTSYRFYAVCVSRLYDVMTKIYKVSRESGDVEISIATTFDTAVAALGKICEFQRDIIDGPVVIIFQIPIFFLRKRKPHF